MTGRTFNVGLSLLHIDALITPRRDILGFRCALSGVGHIEQYWRGGKTIPENARLIYRHCNSARPRAD